MKFFEYDNIFLRIEKYRNKDLMNYKHQNILFLSQRRKFYMDINLLEGKVGILYSFNWSKLITIL